MTFGITRTFRTNVLAWDIYKEFFEGTESSGLDGLANGGAFGISV